MLHILIIAIIFNILPVWSVEQYNPQIADPILERWRWKLIDQLSGKGIRCITEGPDRVMWFGVDQGIMSYDGLNWAAYPISDSTTILPITSLCATSGGVLYVGTQTGLFLFRESNWERVFPPDTSQTLPVTSITELTDGSILAAFGKRYAQNNNGGLIHCHDNRYTFYATSRTLESFAQHQYQDIRFYHIPEHISLMNLSGNRIFNVLDVFQANDGIIYTAVCSYSEPGLIATWRNDTEQSKQLVLKNIYTERHGLQIRDNVKIAQAKDGKIWIVSNAYEKGVNYFDGRSWKSFLLSDLFGGNDSQNCIAVSSDSAIWIDGHGKFFLFKNNRWKQYRLPDVPIPSSSRIIFYEDSHGSIWIAGKQNVVFKLDYTNENWTTYKKLIYQCSTVEGRDWFLTATGRAVRRIGSEWESFGTEDGLMETPVRLMVTSYGEMWAAGSQNGIAATAYFDGARWQMQRHENFSWGIDYRAVLESEDGSLWFGCGVDFQAEQGHVGGILRLKNPATDKDSWIHYSEKNGAPIRMAYGIGQSRDGKIWVGGRNVWQFDGQSWQIRDDLVALREYVDIVHSSPSADLWLGFRNYGLFHYNGESWRQYTVDDGLSSNSIISICAEHDSSVWVATEKDIARFDGETFTANVLPAALNMDREGGSLHVSADGTVWINRSSREWKRRAISQQHPQHDIYENVQTVQYNPDRFPPDTKVTIYSEKVGSNGTTSIFWSGADTREVTPQGKLQYSFRLNDEDWSPFRTTTNHTFFDLSPGRYHFEIRARDMDFNVDPTSAKIEFRVLPPIWREPWFIIAAILMISLVTVLEIRVLRRDRVLHKLNAQLSERTKELENYSHKLEKQKDKIEKQRDRLREMVKKIQELSEIRLRFFTNISHEFRTPLTLILGPIERLLTKKITGRKERTQSYQIIQRNANRLLRLINQILEVYRVEEGTLTFAPVTGDIVKFIREIYSLFTSLAQERQLSYSFRSSVDRIVTCFDHDKIEKIMFNLLSNSFKNTPENGSISVHVMFAERPPTENGRDESLIITVTDNGKGIPAEDIEHVFERFYQTKSSAKHVGSGIGLSYIKDLVEIHRGRISVTSKPDQETVFTIQIPVQAGEKIKTDDSDDDSDSPALSAEIQPVLEELRLSITTDRSARANAVPAAAAVNTFNHRLLIVDDDNDVRDYLKRCLGESYHIDEARNGQEGIKQAAAQQPDLIISDVMMPEMDGIEFCKLIKSDFNTSHIPVILLTARTASKYKVEGFETGADDYITKPFDSAVLETRIKNIIDSRKQLKQRFRQEIMLQPRDMAFTSVDEQFLQKVVDFVHEHMDDTNLNAQKICSKLAISRVQLYRKIKTLTGETVHQFIKSIRLKHAARLMIEKKLTVSEAAYSVGFSEHSNFTTHFKKQFGMSPSQFIVQQGENE